MSDYGHELEFGVFLSPAADQLGETLRLARAADESGLDLVSVQDHPYQAAFLDAWTLLSVIAASTTGVRVFPNVTNLPLRPPAVLARSAASLDVITGGRVELGLGAGAFWDGIAAMGGPRRTTGESVDALAEAIGVLRALWTPGRGARVDGRYYSLAGAHPGPFPVHPIGIWVGAYKPRMLGLTGRLADATAGSSPCTTRRRTGCCTRGYGAGTPVSGRCSTGSPRNTASSTTCWSGWTPRWSRP